QGVWLVQDDTYTLEVIEKHAVVEQNTALLNSFYQQLVVKGMSDKEGKTFVPIIPGYSIITYIPKIKQSRKLRAAVIQRYPDTFINFTDKRILGVEKKNKSIQNQMKRKGEIIVKGLTKTFHHIRQ
ncbi:4963_t:CDS:2, partial [Entrophospora sp. SA101]